MHKPSQDPNPEYGVMVSFALMGGFALAMLIVVIGCQRENLADLFHYLTAHRP